MHSGSLSALRGATPPPKNTLSHANRRRDPKMAEQLFWSVLEHLQTLQPAFGGNRRPRFAFRFKRLIHVVDSTTIQLMIGYENWTSCLHAQLPLRRLWLSSLGVVGALWFFKTHSFRSMSSA